MHDELRSRFRGEMRTAQLFLSEGYVAKTEDLDKRRTLRVLAGATGCAAPVCWAGRCLRLMIANATPHHHSREWSASAVR